MPDAHDAVHEIIIPASHPSLDGHFPGRPMVPAAVILQRVANLATKHFPGQVLCTVPRAKFLRPLPPETCLHIVLTCDATAGCAYFRGIVDGALAVQGEMRFRDMS